jgi:hypothetical protein
MDTGGLGLPAVSLEDLLKMAKELIKIEEDGKTI